MKIGILGGSFDPVHNGHVSLAEKAVKCLELDFLYLVPVFAPPHKKNTVVSAKERTKMLELAFSGKKNIFICRFEIDSGKTVYTYQTVEWFKKQYPAAELFLIMGSDSSVQFKNWRYPDRITKYCCLAVAGRKGHSKAHGDFVRIYGEIPDVSSTAVRALIKSGGSLRGLVPLKVEEYIYKNGLYK